MPSVLTVYSLKGCVAVCNERCHGAKQPSELKEPRRNACTCICGGANHGLGLAHAVRNVATRRVGLSRAALEAFALMRGLVPDDLVVIDRTRVKGKARASLLAKKKRMLALPPPGDLFYCEEVSR